MRLKNEEFRLIIKMKKENDILHKKVSLHTNEIKKIHN